MGGAGSMQEEGENCIQIFGRKTGREEHAKGLAVDERIILEWILGK
jgi:hypothetical protein